MKWCCVKKIILTVFLVIVLPVFLINSCSNIQTSKGSKNGIIVKVADEGTFHATHEAELIRGGMSNGSGSFGVKPFDFTIQDKNILIDANNYFEEQKEIRVDYHCDLMAPWSSGNKDNCFADKIEEVK